MQQTDTDIHQMKDQLLQRKINGESVASIAADTGIPRSTVYSWIAAAREAREEDARKKGEIQWPDLAGHQHNRRLHWNEWPSVRKKFPGGHVRKAVRSIR